MMSELHAYQASFTAHLRDPSQPKPPGAHRQRMAVYREIVFNNFHASVSACFPVLHAILGKRKFKQLVRQCFQQQQFSSPLFRDIPQTFVEWLQAQPLLALGLPAFAAQLAHYEWIELYLANLPVAALSTPTTAEQPIAQRLQQPLQLNPAHVLLAYDYPVHQLSKRNPSSEPAPTFFCLLRKPDFSIQFIQLNAVSWQLLQMIEQQMLNGEQALTLLATQLQHPQPALLLEFGYKVLTQLHTQQVLI